MRLFKALGSDVLRLSLNRYNRTEPTPWFGIFELFHSILGNVQGDTGEVEIAESVVICRWNLFGVAVDVGEFFAFVEGFFFDGWLAEDGEVGDAGIH